MSGVDDAVKRYEAGDAWDDESEVVDIQVRKPLDKVIPVRLSGDKWAQMYQLAHERGVGPTTLARMWLLERLKQETESAVAPRGSHRRYAAKDSGTPRAAAADNVVKSGPRTTRRSTRSQQPKGAAKPETKSGKKSTSVRRSC
jgi:hypothetical protein